MSEITEKKREYEQLIVIGGLLELLENYGITTQDVLTEEQRIGVAIITAGYVGTPQEEQLTDVKRILVEKVDALLAEVEAEASDNDTEGSDADDGTID